MRTAFQYENGALLFFLYGRSSLEQQKEQKVEKAA